MSGPRSRSFARLGLGLAIALFATSPALAQKAHIQFSQGPYFQGEAVDIHLVVEDFEENPTPEIEVTPPAGTRLDFTGVSPSTRSSISIINGRMTQTKEVRFVFQYRFVASEPGRYAVGPFRVIQGATTRTTGPVQIEVKALGRSDRVRIATRWPDAEVFPGQRIRVALEWSLEDELYERMRTYQIEVPIFNRPDLFRYVDEPAQQGDTNLSVQTTSGPISLRAQVSERVIDGRRFKVIEAERVLIPLKPGHFEFPGSTVMVEEITRWRRDLFGQRTPQAVRKVPTIDERRTLVVSDVPLASRPPSYAGAIGRGFSLEVSADRSVVQVGDPIELTFELRGDGNLDGAGLPDLSTAPGLSPDRFRVPTAPQAGVVKDGAKTFRLQVRVLDASVREIPPIPYSYFDSQKKEYVTVESRPIALSVRRAQVITADDVVSGPRESQAEPEAGAAADADVPRDDAAPRGLGDFALAGADLSIVREPGRLVSRGGAAGAGWAPAAIYVGSLGLLGFAWGWRRRSDLDPETVERERRFALARKQLNGAKGQPRSRAMGEIADALRSMLRAAPGSHPAELDAFLSRCDAVAYAPDGGSDSPVEPEVIEQALALADAIEEGAR